MREIKFRAWDNATSRMLETGFNILGEVTCFNIIEQKLMEPPLGKTTLERIGDVVIMQYTGLKDRNGKEIYEGDIVDSGKGEIFWDTKFCQFRVRWHDKVFKRIRGGNPNYRGGEMLFWNSEIAWEVIGNIYEHPHLLTPA